MSKLVASAAIAVSVLASSTALAAEKTITLAVKNMYCADCPFIVRSRAGSDQGSRLVQGQDGGSDLRRYQDRRRRTYPRDDGCGISLRAEELNRPCVIAPSSRLVQSVPSLQPYVA